MFFKDNTIITRTLVLLLMVIMPAMLFADAAFEQLMAEAKYEEALNYVDSNIPPPQRTPEIWVQIAQANDQLGMVEKALASYLVSWRINPNDYHSLMGAATIYNRLNQFQNAFNMSQSALQQQVTYEASRILVTAAIELNKVSEVKSALEQVIAREPDDVVVNRELGNLYYKEGDYVRAVPLLKVALQQQKSGEMNFRVGKSYLQTGVPDSALVYLYKALESATNVSEAALLSAHAHLSLGDFKAAAENFEKVDESMMTASDHYHWAVAKKRIGDAGGAEAAYRTAVSSFGQDTSKKALLAREKVGLADFQNKEHDAALAHFTFIVQADKDGAVVPAIYFHLADVSQAMGNSVDAIWFLVDAIERDDRNIEAYARLADLYEKNNMSEKAKETYETMIALDPNDPSVFLALGQYNLESGRYHEAMEHFQTSNTLTPSAAASEGLAIAAFRAANLATAAAAAEMALSLNEDAWQARKIIAEVLYRKDNFSAALPHFKVMVEREPGNIEFLQNLANCYRHNNLRDKLAKVDRKITQVDQSDAHSRLRLALYADSKNDFETALEMYNDLALLTPNNQHVFKRIFEISHARQMYKEAIEAMRKYIAIAPQEAEAHRDLGDALYEVGAYDCALEAYREAIAIDPNIRGFYQRYAEIVIARGEHGEVIKALTLVINSGDADFGTYTTLGMIYQRRGEHQDAIKMYSQALTMDPTNTDALTALGESQVASGDLGGAIISYEQAVMMNPDAQQEYRKLGDIYAKQQRAEDAMRAYKRYLDRKPDDQEIARKVGKFAHESSEYEEVITYLGPIVQQADNTNLFVIYANALFKSGDYVRSVEIVESIKGRKELKAPEKRDVLRMLALSYEQKNDQKGAAQAYLQYIAVAGTDDPDAAYRAAYLLEQSDKKAAVVQYEKNMKSYPDDIRNVLRLGLLYSDNQETASKALPLLQRSIAVADSLPQVWLEMARIHGSLGDTDKELEAYNRYVQFDPQSIEANRRIGIVLMGMGEVNEALISLEIANAFSPDDPGIMTLLAEGYVKTKRLGEATELLVRAKAVDQTNTDIRFRLFELYDQAGKIDLAHQEIEQLVELEQDNTYLLMYAKMLVNDENLSKAQEILMNILEVEFDNIDALMLKAQVQRLQGYHEEALDTYEEIDMIYPQYAPSLYQRGETHLELQRPRWADTFFNRAIRADPDYVPAYIGLARYYKSRNDDKKYREFLKKAGEIDPGNEALVEELSNAADAG